MTRAVANIERFADRGNGIHAWLSGIHRHVVVDSYRRINRERPVDAHHFARQNRWHHWDEAEETAALDEEAVLLRRAFARLSPKDQEILELRVVAGLTVEQAARTLRRRPGAVRMAQSRALARLRTHLASCQSQSEGGIRASA
jgi:RNA polymerase sigma-70 factor (ECF subfamily)